MTPELYTYLLNMSLREHPVLELLRLETSRLSAARMQICPEQGQLMAFLIQLIGAKRGLEIGTFTGYSALVMALALPPTGKLITCDINQEWTSIAKTYWEKAQVADKIELRLAPALDTLNELIANGESGTFDFIFIDADKANYLNYYQLAYQLLRQGGLIIVDNVLWGGDVADPSNQDKATQAIRQLNAFIAEDKRIQLSLVPIGDGLTLVRKIAN